MLPLLSVVPVFMKMMKPKPAKGFDKIKDIVRGTISTEIDDIEDAYEHFKKTPGLRIIAIKEKLHALQNITVNFVFKEAFIGEMQFRYGSHPPNYHANRFVYAIERARERIEMLESLNIAIVRNTDYVFKSLQDQGGKTIQASTPLAHEQVPNQEDDNKHHSLTHLLGQDLGQ